MVVSFNREVTREREREVWMKGAKHQVFPLTIIPRLSQVWKKAKWRQLTMMSQPIILSDEEDNLLLTTPIQSKKRRPPQKPGPSSPTVVLLDDDPTPQKPGPSFVPYTPIPDVSILKSCDIASSDSRDRVLNSEHDSSGKMVVLIFDAVFSGYRNAYFM